MIFAVVDKEGTVVNMIVAEDSSFNPGEGLQVVAYAPGAAIGGAWTKEGGFVPPIAEDAERRRKEETKANEGKDKGKDFGDEASQPDL